MRKRRDTPFKRQMFLALLLAAMLPLVLCSTLLVGIFKAALQRADADADAAQAAKLSEQLDDDLNEVRRALTTLAGDAAVQLALTESGSEGWARNAYAALYQTSAAADDLAALGVYDSGGALRFSTQDSAFETQLTPGWGVLQETAGGTVFARQSQQGGITGAYAVYAENRRIGYVVCSLPAAQLATLLGGHPGGKSDFMVLNGQWRLVCSSVPGDDGSALERLRDAYITTGRTLKVQDSTRYTYSQAQTGDFTVVLMQPFSLSSSNVRLMQLVSLAFAMVCLLLCVLASVRLTRSLYEPIRELSDVMGKVRAGDLSTRVLVTRSDEFGQLDRDFNAMTEFLQKDTEAQVQHEKDLNAARIRQMQAQLNPHFLYNTLDTMKWLAKIHKVPQVADMAGDLAAILRTGINSEQFVTLQKELELVTQYVSIQKIRFSGRFDCVLEVDDELLDCIVPKLILQPLVENAIVHGLAGCENGIVRISARVQGDGTLEITVSDDGCGMDTALLARLNDPEPKMVNNHLGIYNVSSILLLYYGAPYGLHAVSGADNGTAVTVRIPLQREEQPHD